MVVEDDDDIRDTLVEMLQEEGYRAIGAANGGEAFDILLGGFVPRVILLDLVMPRMDGWDFRAQQLRDSRLKDIPVIILTAMGFRSETIQNQLHGVRFVRKPPRAGEIVKALAQACGTA
jgi:CheY-like chemotaxis protein